MPKTWNEKLNPPTQPHISIMSRKMFGVPEGAKLFIADPRMVKAYIEAIPPGESRTVLEMRSHFAQEHRADATCPISTGIFVRIVAEAALEDLAAGKRVEEITPFWRIVDPGSPLANKLSCDPTFIAQRREIESVKSGDRG